MTGSKAGVHYTHMETRTKLTDYQITPEVQSYLDERLAVIEKLADERDAAARADVELGRDTGHKSGDVYFAEINIHAGGDIVRSSARGESVNAAIDEAKDEILKQIRTRKQLHRRFLRKSGDALKRFMRFGGGTDAPLD